MTIGSDGRPAPRYGSVGPPVDPAATTRVVEFNDVEALERELAHEDVACVLVEPALTNIGIVLPDPGYHDELRRITRETGTLLIIDETHTLSCGPGGYTGAYGLEPDAITMGKPIAGGIPTGAYGLSDELADRVLGSTFWDAADVGGVGGTLAGNALQLAAVRATLGEVLTAEAYERMIGLGRALRSRRPRRDRRLGLDWRPSGSAAGRAHVLARAAPQRRRGGRRRSETARRAHGPLHANRRDLMTPFHMMALISPATTAEQVDAHSAGPRRDRRRAGDGDRSENRPDAAVPRRSTICIIVDTRPRSRRSRASAGPNDRRVDGLNVRVEGDGLDRPRAAGDDEVMICNGAKPLLVGMASIMAATGAATAAGEAGPAGSPRARQPGHGGCLSRPGAVCTAGWFQVVGEGLAPDQPCEMPKHHDARWCHEDTKLLSDSKPGERLAREGARGRKQQRHTTVMRRPGPDDALRHREWQPHRQRPLTMDLRTQRRPGPWGTCDPPGVHGRQAEGYEKEHGDVFEISKDATRLGCRALIKAMGRAPDEAVWTNRDGVVYMTEDNGPGRLLPRPARRLGRAPSRQAGDARRPGAAPATRRRARTQEAAPRVGDDRRPGTRGRGAACDRTTSRDARRRRSRG